MIRFALFVDGSNLFGSLKSLAITVDDYQEFYSYLFRIAEQQWRQAVGATPGTRGGASTRVLVPGGLNGFVALGGCPVAGIFEGAI